MNRVLSVAQLLQQSEDLKFVGTQQNITEVLEKWADFLSKKTTIVTDVYRVVQYNDEPTFDHFHADVNIPNKEKYFGLDGEGFSFTSADVALIKCLGEAAERFSTFIKSKSIIAESLKKLRENKVPHLDPQTVTGVQDQEWVENAKINWVQGWELTSRKPILIPSQLVWLSESRYKGEKLIYPPISTGAASSSALSSAVYQGICECLERDAYMITYLRKLSRQRVNLLSHSTLAELQEKAERYNLEIAVFEITTDIPVPTFMALTIDRTGYGPAVTVGLKADLDPLVAIQGAIEESFHPRNWLRAKYEDGERQKKENLNNLIQRGLFWYDQLMLKHLDFLLKNNLPAKDISEFRLMDWSGKNKFGILKKIITANKLRTYVVEITHPELKQVGIRVAKVIMPDLQPLYLQEKYRCWQGKRLDEAPERIGYSDVETEINPIPHPFL